MASKVNIIFFLDGTNIKDDVVKRTKEGKDGLENIQTCCLGDRFDTTSTSDNTDVNILIITPSMSNEVNKYADKDFSLIFPNTEKSLLLVCDPNSESNIKKIISRSVNYAKIQQFSINDVRGWKYSMIPTIKEMASQEKDEPSVPCINRYLIQPRFIDSCVAEVCLVFLEDLSQDKSVKVSILEEILATTQLSKGVYVFSPQGLSPGVLNVNVMVGDEDYGSTTLEVQSDMNKLKTMVQKTLQRDPLTLFSTLLGSNICDKEDIERDLIEILQEQPLELLEKFLRLEFTDGKQDKDVTSFTYPSLLHFCAANGMYSVCEWMLDHAREDKGRWKNRDGLIPAQLAKRENYSDLSEILDPEKPRVGPPPPVRPRDLSLDSNFGDEEAIFLPSPISGEVVRPVSMPTCFLGSDSGRSTDSFASGCVSDNGSMISFQHSTRERPYNEIDDSKFSEVQACQSASLRRKFQFQKCHTYSEIEDLDRDSDVQLSLGKEPPYKESRDIDPILGNIPIQPSILAQIPWSEQPRARVNNRELKSLRRHKSLSDDTRL